MRAFLLAYFSIALINPSLAFSERQSGLLRRDICSDNQMVDCDTNCMPVGSRCCNDGSGTYCPSGDVCIPGGCCPIGKKCSGPGATMTNNILTGTGSFPTDTTSRTTRTPTTNQAFSSTSFGSGGTATQIGGA